MLAEVIPADLATSRIANARAIDLNVPSGTCADKGIVNVKHKEFVMTSQQANIGTSRPTRYTVVVDSEPEIQLEEIEHLTHWLAHAHQACFIILRYTTT
uniref:Piwi domain-containing protein n=1 Tax=Heterorhabditis bacteriophora TaxID=37862 RepID=A0A1I7XTD0_HETBA